MGARAYRIFVRSVNGSTAVSIGELELRATAGGAAQNGGVAIYSGQADATIGTTGHAASNAFDGLLTTRWAVLMNGQGTMYGAYGAWLGRDYGVGANVEVEEFFLGQRSDCCTDQGPNRFVLQRTTDDPADLGARWYNHSAEYSGYTWTLGQTRVFTGPFTPTTFNVYKLQSTALIGGWDNAITVSKLKLDALVGGIPNGLMVSKLKLDALVGAEPARVTTSKLTLQALLYFRPRATNGSAQII
jgi:hypothetical protein